MNDDEVRALRDGLRILGRRPSDANIDRMAREVLRRGEVIDALRAESRARAAVIATYEGIVARFRGDWYAGEGMATGYWVCSWQPDATEWVRMSDAERALLEGEAP